MAILLPAPLKLTYYCVTVYLVLYIAKMSFVVLWDVACWNYFLAGHSGFLKSKVSAGPEINTVSAQVFIKFLHRLNKQKYNILIGEL